MATANGEVKKTPLKDFKEVRKNGKIAMDLDKGDGFVAAKLVHETDEVVLVTSNGQAIRFQVKELRSASRTSGGVRGISLARGGKVVAMEVVQPNHELFTITEKGFGKRTPYPDYPRKHRGGMGVRNYDITPKTGPVVAARTVDATQELIVISRDGIVIRTRMDSIRMTGRAAQGVSVINVAPGDSVASLATINMGTLNGNGGPKGGKAEEAEQAALEGLEEPPAKGAKKGAAKATKPAPKKPTPIRPKKSGGGKSAPMRSSTRAQKPASKPLPKQSKGPKGKKPRR
jgi:DNA gyrase subunit A